MISVLQASAWYPPSSMGGTEVYVSGLVRELRALGVNSTVAAPLGHQHADYRYEGTAIRTYPIDVRRVSSRSYGADTDDELSRFREILAEVQPDVYHQHSWTLGLELPHLRTARELGLKTIVTAHVPGVVCRRGTMMRFGAEVCDGRIDPFSCAACWNQGRGAPKPLALALAAVSSWIGPGAERPTSAGRLTNALSAFAAIKRMRADVAVMADCADRIVAVCQWLYDALLLNGVPVEKLVLSRQGVDCQFATAVAEARTALSPSSSAAASGLYRLLYIGRWQAVKGIDVVTRAIKALPPEIPVELVIHGTGDGAEERDYQAKVRRIAGGDSRIRIMPPVTRDALPTVLAQADALAVPSQWLETGPLVALEAKAAGLPILGSRLGGIAELVREPDDGLLVAPDDVGAWTRAIARMIRSWRPIAARTSAKVRTMREVALDMSELYRSLAPGGAQSAASLL